MSSDSAGDAPVRRLEIVATVGPSCLDAPEQLVAAGASALRLNASHMSPGALRLALSRIRSVLPVVPVVIDLQGAKMRLGDFAPRPVHRDEVVPFSLRRDGSRAVPLPHPELFAAVDVGDTLSIDDDRIHLRVAARRSDGLLARATRGGELRPRKGVNVVEHPVRLADLSEADDHVCDALGGVPGLLWAFSFMTDGREADWIRRRVEGARVIGKVERREAVENLDLIASRVDSVWICWGDLGAQVGLARLARFVSSFAPAAVRVPVLMAGQVVEHLTHHAEPTRSEVCHLHDLVARGYSGFVLSDETAVGAHPAHAVATLRHLVRGFSPLAPGAPQNLSA
jgi:pyruvate kinase